MEELRDRTHGEPKDQGVDPAQIDLLEKDLQLEMPKVLLQYAESRVKNLSYAMAKPSAYEVHQVILAIEEAEKAGADKEKTAELKKEMEKYV